MGTRSRDRLYGSSVRMAAARAAEARRQADQLACDAWTKRMLAFKGPAQPSPALGDALNAGFRYLEVRCIGWDRHSTVDLTIVQRPKATTSIPELERWMACRDCCLVRGYRDKRGQLVALRQQPISVEAPLSVWGTGER